MVAPTNRSGPYLDGDSIGWEGDTLVVHTIGFNGKTWVDHAGHPHSDQLHVNRADPNNLLIEFLRNEATSKK